MLASCIKKKAKAAMTTVTARVRNISFGWLSGSSTKATLTKSFQAELDEGIVSRYLALCVVSYESLTIHCHPCRPPILKKPRTPSGHLARISYPHKTKNTPLHLLNAIPVAKEEALN